jgi:hypothetical protein
MAVLDRLGRLWILTYPRNNLLRNGGEDRENLLQLADVIEEAHSFP